MLEEIKNKIDKELIAFIDDIDKLYSLNNISPLLFQSIKDFILRDGKRLRPIIFIISYLGFSKKYNPGLYKSALSIELLHDFMLVHDDIIDKSNTRRNKPSMHTLLNKYLTNFKNIKFSGEDLSIVIGDIMYAMAINAFLKIEENPKRKEKALQKFIEAAVYTACGEFIELINGIKDIKKITKNDIYQIYDCKTAYYTFACPLSAAAMLADADNIQTEKLFQCGMNLGRAFQIKDDILGMFGDKHKIGKSTLTDLQESKKTILIWYAYNNCTKKDKKIIHKILSAKTVKKSDIHSMHKIIRNTNALAYCKNEVSILLNNAHSILNTTSMKPKYKDYLYSYSRELLTIPD